MQPGDKLEDRFLLERVAGSGGMGTVYKATDEKTGLPVAIKCLTAHHGEEAGRFSRESRILAELEHPQIVRYVAHGKLPTGEPYLAMEWLEGEDLSTHLAHAQGPLAVADVVCLGERIAHALGFAHARGIVHRDLKPSNIYLVQGAIDSVKLLDFGIAKVDAISRMTRTGMLIGTPGYMAPEQARGEYGLDARADVFSLGCVLFECLVGEPAFTGPHLMAVLARILFDEPPTAREKNRTVPDELSRLIARMMAKNPSERPADGHEVADLLHALNHARDASNDVTLEQPMPSSEGLTRSEQRAVAAILICAPSTHEISNDSTIRTEVPAKEDANATLRQEARAFGAEMEQLLDGSLAIVLTNSSYPTDLAAQAARCALAFRAHQPGRTIALAIGRGERMGRLPMGPAIDRAAHLMELARTNLQPILIDERVVGLLDARFDVREVENGFTLHGERDIAIGTRTLLGKTTPCVGRDWELRSIEQQFEECTQESAARAILVTAPAGRGKSRLMHEFLRPVLARPERITIWIGRGDPLRAGSAFGLLGQAIRGACGIRDGDPLALRRQRLSEQVHERIEEKQRNNVVEFLGELIGVSAPDTEESLPLRAARRDAQLMLERMREAFLTFLRATCAHGPVIILFEDLHWGDRSTVQFLDRALRDLYDLPLFVFALARPEVHEVFPKLWADRPMQEFKLKELNRKAVERLARHVLGDAAGKETIDRLARLSEGNAFYLEELIRRAAAGQETDLPETLVAMAQSRLLALDDDARRILRAASVFGEMFWSEGVACLLGNETREPWIAERLRDLLEKEVIVPRGEGRFPGQREFAFRHALLREAAYTMLTDHDRTLGHRLAGEWLAKRGEQDALVLAEHFERGGDQVRAGQCYLRAAEQTFGSGDAAGAIAHARRGLACEPDAALRLRLLGVTCESAIWLVEHLPATLPDAEALLRAAQPGSKPWLQAMNVKLHAVVQAGRIADLLAGIDEMQRTSFTPEAAGLMVHTLVSGANILDNIGQIEKANALMERAGEITQALSDQEPLAFIMWHGIECLRCASTRKNPWSAIEHGRAAVEAARAAGHPRLVGAGKAYLGMNFWLLGANDEAEKVFNEISLPDDELGYSLSRRHFSLTWLFADRGAFDDAKRSARRLIDAGVSRRVKVFEGLGRWVLAEALRRAGERSAAEIEIMTALELLDAPAKLERPGALATLAAIRLAQGRPAEALTIVEDAVAQASTMGACSRFFRDAFLALTHAECLLATNNHEPARATLEKARLQILEVADRIADPTYRRCYLEDVPENRRIIELCSEFS